MSNMTQTSPAVGTRTYDSTPIDRLAVHLIVDGHAACNHSLSAMFIGDNGPVTCKRCARKASA